MERLPSELDACGSQRDMRYGGASYEPTIREAPARAVAARTWRDCNMLHVRYHVLLDMFVMKPT